MKSIFKFSVLFCLVLSLRVGSVFAAEIGAKKSADNIVTALSQGRIIDGEVDYMFEINNIDVLESLSELIIKGKILPNSESIVENPSGGDISGYTLTEVEITDVFYGEVSEGDIITLVEPYYEALLQDGKTYFITRSGYLPSIAEEEYILFLVQNKGSDARRNGSYEMYNTIMGRYPVPKQSGIKGIAPSQAKEEGTILKAFPPIGFKITIKGDSEMNYRIENQDRADFRLSIFGDLPIKHRNIIC